MSCNAAALEAVIARADLVTAAERVFLESESAPETTHVATSHSSPVRFGSVDAFDDERSARLRSWRHLKDVLREHPEVAHRIARARRPGANGARADGARAADDARCARSEPRWTLLRSRPFSRMRRRPAATATTAILSAAWLRRASWETLVARRDRARRRAEAREIARRDPVELWTVPPAGRERRRRSRRRSRRRQSIPTRRCYRASSTPSSRTPAGYPRAVPRDARRGDVRPRGASTSTRSRARADGKRPETWQLSAACSRTAAGKPRRRRCARRPSA